MAKNKTRKNVPGAPTGGSAHIRKQYDRALDLIENKQWTEAIELLTPLSKAAPNNYDVWAALADSYYRLEQYNRIWPAVMALLRLDPHDSDNWFNAIIVSMANNMVFNAQYYIVEFLKRFPSDSRVKDVTTMRLEVETIIADVLASEHTEPGATPDDLRETEQVSLLIASGDYDLAETLISQTLERSPNLVAPVNNLCLLYGIQGDFPEAISAAELVLEDHPDNIHALSNLAHLLWRSGKTSEAEAVVARMADQPIGEDVLLLKQLEALSCLGKDDAVIALFERAEAQFKQNNRVDTFNAMAFHLAAVAYSHQGDDNRAKQLWQRALKVEEKFSLAQENLDNLRLPVGERVKAFPFAFFQWVPVGWFNELNELMNSPYLNKKSAEKIVSDWYAQHQELAVILPILFDRGDSQSRDFALMVASNIRSPILVDFALSSNGTDADRQKAARIAVELGLLSGEEPVSMVVKGKTTELLLLNYEVTEEPDIGTTPKPIQKLIAQSYDLLTEERFVEAEALVRSTIAKAPNEPGVWNHLMMALQGQDKHDEVKKMTYEVFERFPDYLFGQCAMIQLLVKDKKLTEARALLDPILKRKKFHISEFRALSAANIDLLMAEDKRDAAESWLDLWEDMDPDPDNTLLTHYQARLVAKAPLRRLANMVQRMTKK